MTARQPDRETSRKQPSATKKSAKKKKRTKSTRAKPNPRSAHAGSSAPAPAAPRPRTRGHGPHGTVHARGAGTPDLSTTDLDAFRLDDLDPRSPISPHFRIYELLRSSVAERHGIANVFPSVRELTAAVFLARNVLEPIRGRFGPLTPNSVFRSQALERALKNKPSSWISTSAHTRGEACDVEVVGMPTLELAAWAAETLPDFDQIICECYDPSKGPNSGWVHIAVVPPGRGANRRRLLSYIKDPVSGRMVYVEGLRPTVA